MTEWEKYKVTELKDECKARNISMTGLKLKQQFVDKLAEYESSNSHEEAPAEEGVADTTVEQVATDDPAPEKEPAVHDKTDAPNVERIAKEDGEDDDEDKNSKPEATGDVLPDVEESLQSPTDGPVPLSLNNGHSPDGDAQLTDTPMVVAAEEREVIERDETTLPDHEPMQIEQEAEPIEHHAAQDTYMSDAEEKLREEANGPEPTPIIDIAPLPGTSALDSVSRKRKHSSDSPPPNTVEVSKKVKMHNGAAAPIRRISRSPSPKSPTRHQTTADTIESTSPSKQTNVKDDRGGGVAAENGTNSAPEERSISVDEDHNVEPAMHAATCSIYMKNFKRPLNVQTLRSHIKAIAQSSSSISADTDPIQFFNVNNVRSHAFATFSSSSAASRVRAAMHQTRFPDEPQRDLLWVDFIPDEKVEDWVQQETGGSRSLGRNTAAKLEVVYRDNGNGIEAIFQEVNPYQSQRHSTSANMNPRLSNSQPHASFVTDSTRTAAIASGIHPDRATIVPRSPEYRRRQSPPRVSEPKRRSEDVGHGFSGLDDIFSSTEAKPKLYYKLPPQSVIDERLNLLKSLYTDRGVSGDPGMKRYTLEKDRGREEWVDNGPEFGHGKRGQDRLVGVGSRGRGAFRGRGGGGGGRGGNFAGDFYRGGSRR